MIPPVRIVTCININGEYWFSILNIIVDCASGQL